MNVHGKPYRTIWINPKDPHVVQIIDQRVLPYQFIILDLTTVDDVAHAIKDMTVRGAGLIGATAGYGMYIAALHAPRHSRAALTAMSLTPSRAIPKTTSRWSGLVEWICL
jgi:methylthioribose-1-phosphate isomerase